MIYLIRNACTGNIKIGYTSLSDADRRLTSLQIGNDCKLELLHLMQGSETDEKLLHAHLDAHWIRGEWFKGTAVLEYMEDIKYDLLCLPRVDYAHPEDRLPDYTQMRGCDILQPYPRHFRTASNQLIIPIPWPTSPPDKHELHLAGSGHTTFYWYWENRALVLDDKIDTYHESYLDYKGVHFHEQFVSVSAPNRAGYSNFRWRQITDAISKWTPPQVEDKGDDLFMFWIQKLAPHPDLVGIR